jgi:hypothetical protein
VAGPLLSILIRYLLRKRIQYKRTLRSSSRCHVVMVAFFLSSFLSTYSFPLSSASPLPPAPPQNQNQTCQNVRPPTSSLPALSIPSFACRVPANYLNQGRRPMLPLFPSYSSRLPSIKLSDFTNIGRLIPDKRVSGMPLHRSFLYFYHLTNPL